MLPVISFLTVAIGMPPRRSEIYQSIGIYIASI